jgi:hypothetical protein
MRNDDIFSDLELYDDSELGININGYLDENGEFKDYHGHEYHKDRDYLTFRKLYEKIKVPTREDFYILRNHYNIFPFLKKDYDYSFVKSPSLRHLLFDEPLPQSDTNDPYYHLLDIEIRNIMKNLITLLNKTEDLTVKNKILDKINKIKNTDYIFTEREKRETFIPLLLYENNN